MELNMKKDNLALNVEDSTGEDSEIIKREVSKKKLTLEEQKEKGYVPEWLTEEGFETLQRGYLQKGENVIGAINRVSESTASYLNKPEMAKYFKEAVMKNWLCWASPIWSNAGTERGLPLSCNTIHVQDSVHDIFKKNMELAMLSKHGAGVGIYMGDVRGRGAPIKGNGKSEGIIPWVKVFDTTTNSVNQGCYDDQTEILTENGWMKFDDLEGSEIKVAQVTDDFKTEFVNYTDYIKYEVDQDLYAFGNEVGSVDLFVTDNHNMVIERLRRDDNRRDQDGKFISNKKSLTGKLDLVRADELSLHRDNYLYFTCPSAVERNELSNKDRLAIAYQADGTTDPSGNSNGKKSGTLMYRFNFSKKRKVERFRSLIKDVGYHYTEKESNGITSFYVRYPINEKPTKFFKDHFDISGFSENKSKQFISELFEWDGSARVGKRGGSYSSIDKENVSFVQGVSSLAGYMSNQSVTSNREGNRKDLHNISISYNVNKLNGEKVNKIKKHYNGFVYCVSVPSKKLLVRRGGRTIVCGNSTRRGASACYLPIDHADYQEFLHIRRSTGDHNRRARNMHIGACISDQFMNEAIEGNKHNQHLWSETLKERFQAGEPYMFFTDNVNRQKPQAYVENNLHISSSNICNEIYQFTDRDHTFVCCLSSLNVDRYDEWKDFTFANGMTLPELSIWFLDGIMSEYIAKAKNIEGFENAVRSAEKGRAVGLGVLGFHSYLQKKLIDIESFDSFMINNEIFRFIDDESSKATRGLAKEYGEPEWCKGLGIRNSLRTAVAPTASNSTISGGVSPGIEPSTANVFSLKSAKGTFMKYNRDLKVILANNGLDKPEVWAEIINNNGSVATLKGLSGEEKVAFKTARELNQHTLVKLAAQRQKYIDQGQSLNLFFTSNADAQYIHEVHLEAWRSGLKGLYYFRSQSPLKGQASYISKDECIACEG